MASTSAEADEVHELVEQLLAWGLGPSDAPAAAGERTTTEEGDGDETDYDDEDLVASGSAAIRAPQKPSKADRQAQKQAQTAPKDKRRHLIKHTAHQVEGRTILSWKMAEHVYRNDPCPFPTRARGLFTEEVKDSKGKGKQKIVARGYDKFFNVNEVEWTKWDTIGGKSTGPYELTLKSNGCIIFFSALSPTSLLVTSKHSTGSNANTAGVTGKLSHAQMGEQWLDKMLARRGKTKEELAQRLWDEDLTGIAELCDDSFEEHVLAYGAEETGLHLHGLNRNTATFRTLPSRDVQAFAKEWGFIVTSYQELATVEDVKAYTDEVAKVGGIQVVREGKEVIEPVEGFVVRGHVRGGKTDDEAFFWKVKYEEPYLMYREWREVTRKILSAYDKASPAELSLSSGESGQRLVELRRMNNPLSKLYAWWVEQEIRKDREAFQPWSEGKGIIATRERFLAWEQTEEAQEQRKKLRIKELAPPPSEAGKKKEWERTLLVPVAIPGLGKTFVGLALHHLFGWGHTQSDDIQFKKTGPHFLKNVRELLEAEGQRVVYADKNNHVFKLRSDLLKCASTSKKVTRMVALVWQVDKMHKNTLQKLCAGRIVGRGERHQTLRAGEGHEDVLWMFFSQLEVFDPLVDPDRAFDDVLELDPKWEKEELLAKVLQMLLEKGIISELPTEEQVKKAMAHADGYEPEYKKAAAAGFGDAGAKKKKGTPRYYGVAVEVDVEKVVGEMVAGNEAAKEMLSKLVEDKRLVARPHVTIVHNTEVKAERDEANGAPTKENGEANGEKEAAATEGPKTLLWEECRRLVEAGRAVAEGVGEDENKNKTTDASAVTPEGAATTLTLGPRLVFDSRVMSLEVSSVGPDLSHLVNKASAHVTIGTLNEEVRPVEGKWIFDALRKGEKETRDGGKITVLQVGTEVVKGRLEGLW